MDSSAKQYLTYVQRSLADAARITPSLKKDMVVEVAIHEIERGQLGEYARGQLQRLAKSLAKTLGKDEGRSTEAIWPISVVIAPKVYGLRPQHGETDKTYPPLIAPLLLQAKLSRDGLLSPDLTLNTPVIIPRDLLEPNRIGVSIGRVEDADSAYAAKQDTVTTWVELMRNGVSLFEAITGTSFEDLEVERYELRSSGLALVAGNTPASFALLRLLDLIQQPAGLETPLLDQLIREAKNTPLLTMSQQATLSARHLGQMECRYPLSVSQRESLLHHLLPDASSNLLAVDGPPGTGKTTLLLSAIATLWVERALQEGEAPLIVASSTNNQAVTNILRAFSEVKEKDGPLTGRWLEGIVSYGLYLPAKSVTGAYEFPVHEMRGAGKDAIFDAQRFESRFALDEARRRFLAKYAEAGGPGDADLGKAVKDLHSQISRQAALIDRAAETTASLMAQLNEQVLSSAALAALKDRLDQDLLERMSEVERSRVDRGQAKALMAQWARHQAVEPWWMGLLALVGIVGSREKRDRAFCADVAISHAALTGDAFAFLSKRLLIEGQLGELYELTGRNEAEALVRCEASRESVGRLTRSMEFLASIVGDGEMSSDNVQGMLDVGPRYTAFKLATHYWEGRYLQVLETQFRHNDGMVDSKSPSRLVTQYRRLAMLHPCFVATLFTLPDKLIAWTSGTESVALVNTIDLLIVDEAGQVSPEVGAPVFALAKRALIVGDVDQIEPIWQVPPHIDGANALSSEVVADEAGLLSFRESGVSAASGSLMRLAQRATAYAKFPERGRGMFLSEHRRCWPEIIRMCNVLVYGGHLQPCREDSGARPVVPSVGFVHIPGSDRSRGTSRDNPTEAMAIARWLGEKAEAISAAYAGKALRHLVAVVTPFSAQSKQVTAALSSVLGKGHGITVGTVHALQGAERRIVIFSPTYGLGMQPGTTFMDRNRSILNVAISRAQDAFMVFGNLHVFQPSGKHPCAVVGQMLFGGGSEITGVAAELLVPGSDLPEGRLISSLEGHRDVLQEAMATAQQSLIIVSPFLTESAIDMDQITVGLGDAVRRGVKVRVVSDEQFNQNKAAFHRCVKRLEACGVTVKLAATQGVHSKMLLVDRSWLVIGSFNWLSAVRDQQSAWARHESSLRYNGNDAFEMIGRSLREIRDLVSVRD